ncbi:MAG: AAA family ATPase [Candidatus Sericytochromatia bacterium]
MQTMTLQGVELVLSLPTRMDARWVGHQEVKRQLEAAWLILSNDDLPMNPRIIGKPGIGKTTLAYAVGTSYAEQVFLFQCTVDTRPEDLLVTPVIGSGQQIRYHASPLVTAMLTGGVCILDEGNRMGEKSWASLAPLLDHRRYVESIIAGIKIPAHPEFRLAVTMNDDASTFDVPDYIQSRLQPQIEVGYPSAAEEQEILRTHLPDAPEEVLRLVGAFLQRGHAEKKNYTVRDGVNISRYAFKLLHMNLSETPAAVEQAVSQVLDSAAHAFFVEHCLRPPRESVLHPLEILLLGASGPLEVSAADPLLDELAELDLAAEEALLDALNDGLADVWQQDQTEDLKPPSASESESDNDPPA